MIEQTTHNKPTIVLIHGLFMSGLAMIKLQIFFTQHGYEAKILSYQSISQDIESNAEKLKSFLEKIDGDVNMICHSLGGLLAQYTLSKMTHPENKVKKVVSLGTPWQGASIVNYMKKYKLEKIIGKSLEPLLPKTTNHWQFKNIALGSISGDSIFGARLIFAPNNNTASDGTVTIAETCIEGMTDHISIPVGHTNLIFSDLCAKTALKFIEHNSFK